MPREDTAARASLRKALFDYLLEELPETSEFRPAPWEQDAAFDRRNVKRGRRTQIPLTTDAPGLFTGTLFSDPTIQPAPTTVARIDGLREEETTTVYFAWDFSQGSAPPAIPQVFFLIRWGVGGQTFSRMIDGHRIPRRLALAANYVEILAVYTDFGSPPPTTTVDAIVGIASGEADPNYWTGTWLNTSPTAAATLATQPAAILAASGVVTNIGTATGVYVMFIDTATAPPTPGADPIPGAVSPLLTVGQSFSFDEDEMPGLFCDFGLAYAVSTTPNLYTAAGGGGGAAFVNIKAAF